MTAKVINQILSLVFMMIIGVVLRKKNIITDEVNRGLVNILMNITLPCLIISSFNFDFSTEMFKNAEVMFVYALLAEVLLILVSQLLYLKIDLSKRYIFKFSTIFSNCGFIGYPLMLGLFGKTGVFFTSIFGIPFNLLMFSYGIMLFTKEADFRIIVRNLVNPPLISTTIGIVIFFFSIKLPIFLQTAFEITGNMTTPISMFIIGAMLADVGLKAVVGSLDVYYLSFMKLILAPLLTYGFLRLVTTNELLIQSIVILIAMPTATLVGVFAERFDGNRNAASRCAFVTTVLSIFTIPAVISIL